jgi:hypothetical protein
MDASTNNRRHEPSGGPAMRAEAVDAAVRELSDSECWEILARSGIGHLAFQLQPAGVDILPINYLVTDRQIFFRSAPGSKLSSLALHPRVAFQIERRAGDTWFSVVVKGEAVRLAFDEEIEHSGVLELAPAQPGEKFNYVRITPDTITGRTFAAANGPGDLLPR